MNEPASIPPVPPQEPNPILPPNASFGEIISFLLRYPTSIAQACQNPQQTNRIILRLIIIAILTHLLFGVVLGTFTLGQQLWISPVKLVLGTFFTSLICFPSLLIFSCMTGAKFSIAQLVAALSGALALLGLLLVGFSPALWIFTQATEWIGFIGFLAIVSWLISFAFAMRYLTKALFLDRKNPSTNVAPLGFWSLMFVLVALQMTTTLRPFIGTSPHFINFEKRFFLEHWNVASREWDAQQPTTKQESPNKEQKAEKEPERQER